MEQYFDYKLIENNAGIYYLFVRDFGGPQVHGIEPKLYCFSSGDRAELINALCEIMSNPGEAYLDEWSGLGDIDDPSATLDVLQGWIEESKGGATLVAEGDIYA